MSEDPSDRYYVGTDEPDGSIGLTGPVSSEEAKNRQLQNLKEGKASTIALADTTGEALLKVTIGSINNSKSKK